MRGGCCLTHPLPCDPHHQGAPLPARAPQSHGPRGKEKCTPPPLMKPFALNLVWSPLRASTTLARMNLANKRLCGEEQLTPSSLLSSPPATFWKGLEDNWL